jgi:MFS superfamily sulfate permease-like transporter
MLTTIRHYQWKWLLPDLAAGLTLTAFMVPTGMGYAAASGLPVVYGLYASIAALTAYFVFGPSRILVLGPDSSLAPLIAAAVAAGPVADAPARAAVLAILAGLFCVAAAVLRLGLLTDLVSKPVRIGYLNGIAVTVIGGQLPTFLGMPRRDAVPAGQSFAGDLVVVAEWLWHESIDPTTAALGGTCLAMILLLRNLAPRVPGVLLAMLGAAGAVVGLHAAGFATPEMIPEVPTGLPSFSLPVVEWGTLKTALPVAAAIALVAKQGATPRQRSSQPDQSPRPIWPRSPSGSAAA